MIKELSDQEDNNDNGDEDSFFFSHTLEWPSNSLSTVSRGDECGFHIVLGTNTGLKEQNYLMIIQVNLKKKTVEIKKKRTHNGNVIKVAPMQCIDQAKLITVSSNSTGDINLYDLLSFTHRKTSAKPELMLKEHQDKCFGLSWNIKKTGLLVSGSYDSKVALWDINGISSIGVLNPINVYKTHTSAVEDVAWSHISPTLFASCGDDKAIYFYDTRHNKKYQCVLMKNEIIRIDFNPINANLFLSGSQDGNVALWDLRNTKLKVHTFQYHCATISTLKWNPKSENIFASGSLDKNICIWNINKIGTYVNPVEKENEPSEIEVSK